jgi:acetyltransferase-like isoleucine patch superfamily enzyme
MRDPGAVTESRWLRWRRYLTGRLRGVPWAVLRSAGPGFDSGPGCFFRPHEDIRIGRNVFMGRFVHIASPCDIRDDVMLASFVALVGGDHRFQEPGVPMNRSGREPGRPIVIEEEAWIGHGAIVLSGVTIGRGAIVAAGSIVTTDVPPCTIWGSPRAVYLRERFATPAERERHLAALAQRYAERR